MQCVSNCLRRGRVSAEGQERDPQSAHLLADGMTQVLRDGIAACVTVSRTANIVLSVQVPEEAWRWNVLIQGRRCTESSLV